MDRAELLQILVHANEFKEGDLLVGGSSDERLRAEARRSLGALRSMDFAKTALIEDQVTEALARSLQPRLASEISHLTLTELKRILLSPAGVDWISRYRDGLASEVIAAVVKLMTDDELSTLARTVFNPLPGPGLSIGSRGHFGSRIQPNSPGDDEGEILFSILEGLTYGCGDVIIGLNPASDEVETIVRLEDLLRTVVERLRLPTRYCVLSDLVKQTRARARTRVDVGFQSLAGTSKALVGMVGLDVDGVLDLARGFAGLYFETGQGSAVTNGTAENIDMVTLEARAYGVARQLGALTGAWMIVNDVAGFIGPEVFRSGEQLQRACLEDTVMAKLHGLTMGLDVCATFHMGLEPSSLSQLTERIVARCAPAYLMAVAGNADPMLGYLTTSFRDHPRLRRGRSRQIASPMRERLAALGIIDERGELASDRPRTEALYALYVKAGGDARSFAALTEEGARRLSGLRALGFDLGERDDDEVEGARASQARIDSIYTQAREALSATLDRAILDDVAPHALRVRTRALDREDYLSHPPAGERICDKDASRLARLYPTRRPRVQIVLSDGLNANALNENLRAVLPPLRHILAGAGFHLGEVTIVIENGRVRAGYHVGALLDVEVIIHLIGERPGTGLNTLSAYLTLGRDTGGRSRWSPDLDHACTTAICGINPRGRKPGEAVEEIARAVSRIFEQRSSGVGLGASSGW